MMIWLALKVLLYTVGIPLLVIVGFVTVRFSYATLYYKHKVRLIREKSSKVVPRQKTTFPILQWVSPDEWEVLLKENQMEDGTPYEIMNQGPHLDGTPMIAFSNPDVFREVFTNPTKFIHIPENNDWLGHYFGYGLVTLDGPTWKHHRNALNPLFRLGALRSHVPLTGHLVRKLVEELHRKKGEIVSPNIFEDLALQVIIEVAFGSNFDHKWMIEVWREMNTIFTTYSLYRALFGDITTWLPFPFNFRRHQITRQIRQRVQEQIALKKQQLERGELPCDEEKAHDMIWLMLLSKNKLSDDEIVAEGLTFFFAGRDTSSKLMGWMMYYLAKYPDVQAKVYREVEEIFAMGSMPTDVDLTKMTYLKCVMNESLRLRAPAPGIDRWTTEDVVLDGVFIPKGCDVLCFFHNTHINPKYWEKPSEFIPERWEKEKAENRPFTFLPFGAGERNCIGQRLAIQEAMLVVAMLVREFRVTAVDIETVYSGMIPLMGPVNLKLQFTPR